MPTDVLLNENLDLSIKDGDLDFGESTYQHQQLLLLMEKADLKEYPTTGVASKSFLESENPSSFAREIRQEFYSDGMDVRQIKIADNLELTIDAQYNE